MAESGDAVIVIDTGVFYHPAALRELAGRNDVVVPAIVLTERARQLARAGGDVEAFRREMARDGYIIQPFGVDEGFRRAIHLRDDKIWRRIYRDALIAGHVREGDVLWTTNAADFEAAGVPKHQIVTIPRST